MNLDKEKLLEWLNEKYLDESKTHTEARPFNHVILAIKSGKFDQEVTQ